MKRILPSSSSADSSSSRTSPISSAVAAASAQMSSSNSSSQVAASSSSATTPTSTPITTTASLFSTTSTTMGTSLTPSMSSLLTHGDSKPSLLLSGSSTRSTMSSSSSSILPTRSLSGAGSTTSLLSGSTSSLLPSSSTSSSLLPSSSNNNSSTQSSENLPPRTLARVARDVRDLVKKPPDGIRLVLDDETGMPGSLSEIMAEIEGPEQTPYHTRYFQLKLVLSTDFPATPPRGYFLTKIYHPNVDPTTGAICVNTLKKDWTSSTSLSHVLTVIRCLLIVPFPESSLNDEAGKNFMDSYDEYARRAKLLANVHGLTSWSSAKTEWNNGSGSSIGEGKTPEGEESPEQDDKKKAATDNGLPNGSSGGGGLGKKTSRSNIVRAGSKTLDKKSKKKSLRRL